MTDQPSISDLQQASTELLLERHIGAPLRHITADLMDEVAGRITAAVRDLDETEERCAAQHLGGCLCGMLAARIRRTLTGGTDG